MHKAVNKKSKNRDLENAEKLAIVRCVCGSRISDQILLSLNVKKWEILKQVESGVVFFDNPSSKLKCFNCMENKSLDEIRKFECNHDYCEKCIKKMMQDFKGGSALRCKCLKEIETEVLQGVDKDLYNSYLLKLCGGQGKKPRFRK
eukprot:TRINITY_DN18838_c0_g1_i1.p1 TRINITY_DN18838_c0_g1~~TRINITY_DN18838_c0_g1_i1.p1  ORF type:complete len:146 (-),score=29.35 TRINITY_DN18838_c0_g1_i1:186-623(-)